MPALETPRLCLEPLTAAHAPLMYEALRDERLYRYVAETPPVSERSLRRRFELLESRHSPDGTQQWLNWVIVPRGTGYPVGYLQATVEGERAIVAYVLFRAAQGRGYAREGLSRVLAFLSAGGVREATATIDRRNRRSQRVVEALGFKRIDESGVPGRNEESASADYVYAVSMAETPGGGPSAGP